MVSQEGHSAELLQVKRDEAPAGDSSRDQAHGGPRDADSTERFRKVPRLGRGGEGRGGDVESKGPLYKLCESVGGAACDVGSRSCWVAEPSGAFRFLSLARRTKGQG